MGLVHSPEVFRCFLGHGVTPKEMADDSDVWNFRALLFRLTCNVRREVVLHFGRRPRTIFTSNKTSKLSGSPISFGPPDKYLVKLTAVNACGSANGWRRTPSCSQLDAEYSPFPPPYSHASNVPQENKCVSTCPLTAISSRVLFILLSTGYHSTSQRQNQPSPKQR